MLQKSKLKIITLILILIANIFVWFIVYAESPKDYVTVAFLDVGQGDAVFIEGPTGNQMLIDGGRNKKVLRGLGNVMPFYDRSIDLVLETHPDADHITGLIDVISKYSISGFIDPGITHTTATYRELERQIEKKELKKITARQGMNIDLGGGAYAYILFPDRDVSGLDINDASVIVKIIYGESEVLLTGDSSKKIENYLTWLYGEELNADILKAGHHGSRTSSSNAFLSATDPEYFIVSAEENSRYGHPHKEVIELAESMNLEVLETSKEGNIVFELGVNSIIKK